MGLRADTAQSLLWLERAQCARIDEFRRQFEGVANTLSEQASKLRSIGESADWSGEAADAFEEFQKKLPPLLERVSERYGACAEALTLYSYEIGPLQAELRRLRGDLSEAQRDLRRAEEEPPDHQTTIGPDLDAAVRHSERALENLADRWDEVARVCENRIRDACGDLDDPTGVVASLNNALRAVTGFIVEFPGMDIFREVLKNLVLALSIAALVPGVNAVIAPFLAAAAGTLLVLDVASAVEGEGSWTDVGMDVLAIGTAGVARVARSSRFAKMTNHVAGKTKRARFKLARKPNVERYASPVKAERRLLKGKTGMERADKLAKDRADTALDVGGAGSLRGSVRAVRQARPSDLMDNFFGPLLRPDKYTQMAYKFDDSTSVVQMARAKSLADVADRLALGHGLHDKATDLVP